MLRLQRFLRALPFEPMALSTFDVIERPSSCSRSNTLSDPVDSHVSVSGPPYFISPKHDGVRIVSYASNRFANPQWTCFSRYGRPVHGMFWIEEELRLLRWLCGDPRLVLDGELYIHKVKPQRTGRGGSGKGVDVKSGFLAVSALVHRLRGPKSACATDEEVLNYVSSLPRFCVFDIVSYQPFDNMDLTRECNYRGLSQIEKERVLLMREAMKENEIRDLEMLRVIPNFSAFSQRLKTMNFLLRLLQRARDSSILFPEKTHTPSQSKRPPFTRGRQVRPSTTDMDSNSNTNADIIRYIGGEYVKLIPYSLLHSLAEAKEVYLDRYVTLGYEGAVVRSASNLYSAREKEKGALRGLLEPLLPQTVTAPLLRTYTRDAADNEEGTQSSLASVSNSAEEARQRTATFTALWREAEDANHTDVMETVSRRTRQAPRRSTTAVKLLPFCDKEYAILRPLLKLPSTNPRTRPLLRVPLHALRDGRGALTTPRTRGARQENAEHPTKAREAVFYGLQCLSETGRVFNVPLPRMDAARQRELLQHLLQATGAVKGSGGKGTMKGRRSLTGLYATVKYATLTEYGIPRFAQVKAIRGGKGWFL